MKTHHIALIKEEYAILHHKGEKSWELRKNYIDYTIGDDITFIVVDNNAKETGECYTRRITYVFNNRHMGLVSGYCIFSISDCEFFD